MSLGGLQFMAALHIWYWGIYSSVHFCCVNYVSARPGGSIWVYLVSARSGGDGQYSNDNIIFLGSFVLYIIQPSFVISFGTSSVSSLPCRTGATAFTQNGMAHHRLVMQRQLQHIFTDSDALINVTLAFWVVMVVKSQENIRNAFHRFVRAEGP